jgi:hypothetical protein
MCTLIWIIEGEYIPWVETVKQIRLCSKDVHFAVHCTYLFFALEYQWRHPYVHMHIHTEETES